MPESALAVDVPEAESYVYNLRKLYDPSAESGAPAHITLIYPFIPPNDISKEDIDRIVRILSSRPSFHFSLSSVGRFIETTFLSPDPEQPFIELVESLETEFPLYPPYGGIHDDIKPHLTVANGDKNNADFAEQELDKSFKTLGKIQCVCNRILLLENSTGRWKQKHAFDLK